MEGEKGFVLAFVQEWSRLAKEWEEKEREKQEGK